MSNPRFSFFAHTIQDYLRKGLWYIMIQKPGLFDGYRYLGKQIKMGWDQYGGKVMTVAGTAGLFIALWIR